MTGSIRDGKVSRGNDVRGEVPRFYLETSLGVI